MWILSETLRAAFSAIDWDAWFTWCQHLISHYDAIDLDECTRSLPRVATA